MNNNIKWQRYLYSLLMIVTMVGVAEWIDEKEIIFPEMAALTIGMWIVDKRVWRISRIRMLLLMTLGAIAGICIVRYSPFPLLANLGIAFAFSAVCLMLSKTTLIPQISACMLPVLLNTESWVYPIAVFIMSLIVIIGQFWMEKGNIRQKINFSPVNKNRPKEILRWILLFCTLLIVAVIPVYTSNLYCILPPLIVTYVEFASSKAGFRNRPVQIFLILLFSATMGTIFQLVLHTYLGLSESIVALSVTLCLFGLYEWTGKYFAPAGAIALIPMIVPQENLLWLPLQVAIGAALFISLAMLLFLKCYKWPKAHLIVCMIPVIVRSRKKKSKHQHFNSKQPNTF